MMTMKPRISGGKKIRLDDPIPPEYANPMTPMTPLVDDILEESLNSYLSTESLLMPSDHQLDDCYLESTQQFTEPEIDDQEEYCSTATSIAPKDKPPSKGKLPGKATKNTLGISKEPRKRKASRKTNIDDFKIEGGIFHKIKTNVLSLQGIVDNWIVEYKTNQDAALLKLMQFFINASGCRGCITPEMQASLEHATIIRRMTEEFDEESGEYPFMMSGQPWKKFKSNFCDFVQVLVKQCQYSIIYDQYLMDNIISLLTGLSDSQVRAFRHTATLAAMKLMTALVDVALTVSVNLDNTQRQYEAERAKTKDKIATDRLASLLSKRQELEENIDEIKNMLTYMFKSVFVHRYRDTLAEVRGICIYEIGIWMKRFPQNFLDDSYLKYIGWTLHDKIGEVRLKCLQALQPLYASELLKSKLELFTSKFKDRIVSMTLDKEYDVAVHSIKLVILILKYHRDILTDKDCEHVYELVYSSHRAVAQAAGEFLNERLFIPEDDNVENVKIRKKKSQRPNAPLIRDLVQFFIESELHEHGAYLVDSLIESNEMMKDWETMTDLLIKEPVFEEEQLDDRQETSLIEIMVCAIKQAATGEPPVGRGPNKKILSAKELRQVADDKTKLTIHFMVMLPPLISKYAADPEKVANLLTIPQYFDVGLYSSLRQEKQLDDLLKLIQNIVEKHTDLEVLETCSRTVDTLCCEEHPTFSRCNLSRSTLLDMVVTKFKESLDDYSNLIQGQEEPDEDEIFALVSSLKKISCFSSCHNLEAWDIWEILIKCITDTLQGTIHFPNEAIKYCISVCYFGLLWRMSHLDGLCMTDSAVIEIRNVLKERLLKFMKLCESLLSSSVVLVFKEEAFISICDLLIVFCKQLETNPITLSLIYEPSKILQEALNDFVQEFVFKEDNDSGIDEHTKIEELHKRRNFLASFCKLVVYNVIPTRMAADIFKNYVKFYNDYGDIIKTTLGKCREINKVNCAKTMVLSLCILFKEMKGNKHTQEFHGLKELAKRFALSFGLDAVKNRDAITALHREGILFSLNPLENPLDPTGPPPNIIFLEILSEFTNKLLKQDKKVVLNYLDRRISSWMPSSRTEDWQSHLMYRNSLVQGECDMPPQTSKRAYSRKKREEEDEVEEHEEEIELDYNQILGVSTSELAFMECEPKRFRREVSRSANYLDDLFDDDFLA